MSLYEDIVNGKEKVSLVGLAMLVCRLQSPLQEKYR